MKKERDYVIICGKNSNIQKKAQQKLFSLGYHWSIDEGYDYKFLNNNTYNAYFASTVGSKKFITVLVSNNIEQIEYYIKNETNCKNIIRMTGSSTMETE